MQSLIGKKNFKWFIDLTRFSFYKFQDLAEWVAEGWRANGLDYVKVQTYSMLLDYPNSADPNLIRNKFY